MNIFLKKISTSAILFGANFLQLNKF